MEKMSNEETLNIDVELYDIPVVSSKSFGEAVRTGLSSPVALRAKADSVLIKGQRVLEGCWDWNEAAFLLSGGSSLYIFSVAGYSDWLVGDAKDYDNLRQRMQSPRATVIAKFVTPAGEDESLLGPRGFNASSLVAACIGKEVLRIAVAHTALYFQFRGTSWHVFFEPVKRHDNGEPLLIWIEDRD